MVIIIFLIYFHPVIKQRPIAQMLINKNDCSLRTVKLKIKSALIN